MRHRRAFSVMAATREVSSSASLAAACYMVATSLLLVNLLPILIGALSDAFKIEPARLGMLGSSSNLAAVLVYVTAPFWAPKVRWRRWIVACVAVATIGFAAAPFVIHFAAIAALFFILGLSLSLIGVPAYVLIGNRENVTRAYSFALLAQMGLASALSYFLLGVVAPLWGYAGMMVSLAVVALPCLSCTSMIGRFSDVSAQYGGAHHGSRPIKAGSIATLLVACGGFLIFITG